MAATQNEILAEASYMLTLLSEQSTSHSRVEAIVGLAASSGPKLEARLVPLLLETLNDPRTWPQFSNLLQDKDQARWLLDVPKIRTHLEGFKNDPDLSVEEISVAKGLLVERPHNWPMLWRKDRPEESDAIKQVLCMLGWLERNPFGPENAEDDPLLSEFCVESPLLSWLTALEPQVFSAAPGCGQTAALRLLADRFRSRQVGRLPGQDTYAFAIISDLSTLLPACTRAECLGAISYVIARALLDFFALNPYTFIATHPSQQRAIARLLTAHQDRLGDLSSYLVLAGLENSLVATRLVQQIREAGRGTTPPQPANESDILSTLAEVRLAGFWGIVLMFDLSSRQLVRGSLDILVTRLQHLIGLMPVLMLSGIIVKLGVPFAIGMRLKTDASLNRLELASWSIRDLREMMHRRLEWATGPGGGSLTQLFGPDRPRDPEAEMVKAAQGSPRRLVRLGNTLLIRRYDVLTRSGEQQRLSSNDLAEIIAKIAEDEHANG
jgi:hypothetical protein